MTRARFVGNFLERGGEWEDYARKRSETKICNFAVLLSLSLLSCVGRQVDAKHEQRKNDNSLLVFSDN